jgi:hypothetical protein
MNTFLTKTNNTMNNNNMNVDALILAALSFIGGIILTIGISRVSSIENSSNCPCTVSIFNE